MDEDTVLEDSHITPDTTTKVASNVPDFWHLANLLEIKQADRGNSYPKLLDIYNWAKQESKSEDRVDILLAIKKLVEANGWRENGKLLVNNLYQWVKLDRDRQQIVKEQQLLERKQQ